MVEKQTIYALDGRKPDIQEITSLAKAALVLVIQSPDMNAGTIQCLFNSNG